jgi:hypothetical protein
VASARRSVDDVEERTDRPLEPYSEPRLQLLPTPVVHPDLTTSASLTVTDEQRTAAPIKIRFAEGKTLVDTKARSPQHDDQSAKPATLDTTVGEAALERSASPLAGHAHLGGDDCR